MNRAEAQSIPPQRFFATFWAPHGANSAENYCPIQSTVSSNLKTYKLYSAQGATPQHDIRYGRLVDLKRTHAQTASVRSQSLDDFDNGASRISPLLGSFIPDALLDKLTLIQGVDMLTSGGHTRGLLGNFVNRDGGADIGIANQPVPTIDSVIAQSAKFYSLGEKSLIRVPSLADRGASMLSSYQTSAGVSNNPYQADTVGQMFDMLFKDVSAAPQMTNPKASLVDRVYEDYARLARGSFGASRRIGKDDRNRLEEYMQNLQDVGTRMRGLVNAGCMVPAVDSSQRSQFLLGSEDFQDWARLPADLNERLAYQRSVMEIKNTLLVNAFLCGTTRVFVGLASAIRDEWDPAMFASSPSEIEGTLTDPHHMVFHNAGMADRQRLITEGLRYFIQYGFMDLVQKLDAAQVLPGVSLLDQSLVYLSAESGPETHSAANLPTLFAGGAGGFLKTGNYIDYRNLSTKYTNQYGGGDFRPGVPLNRLLANICQAMGLEPEDYELSDAAYSQKFPNRGGKVPGYGDPYREPVFSLNGKDPLSVSHPDYQLADMSSPLPILT